MMTYPDPTAPRHTEYRLVLERPAHQDGNRLRHVSKRDYSHARKGLQDHQEHATKLLELGLDPWLASVEEREVSEWVKVVFDEAEGVPV